MAQLVPTGLEFLCRFRKLKSEVNFQLERSFEKELGVSLYSNNRASEHVRMTGDCWENAYASL